MGRSAAKKHQRQERIVEALRSNTALRIGELAEALGVSGETIRRDLAELDQSGSVSRTYGGAVARTITSEPVWSVRHTEYRSERTQIAKGAFSLVTPGDIIFLETGSTMMHFAELLAAEAERLTVITSGLAVALAVAQNPKITVHVCPGLLDLHEASVTGAETEHFLQRYNANLAFVGSTGITGEGLYESHPGIGAIKRTMLSRAKRRVALLDHSKFGQASLMVACPLNEVDVLVSDRRPDGELAQALERAGVEILV
ncbi:MAG: DeoR/GlpR transcriptional regulator [Rhodospirillaceae bacterium]|nr:DeoR/GlpR transcriptional regulator [Rhodospirillaceae bacterium]